MQLLKLVLTKKNTLTNCLSALNYFTFDLGLLDPTQQVIAPCFNILRKVIKGSKSGMPDKYPKFVVYLLQNMNQVTLKEFTDRKKTIMPWDFEQLKTVNLILESVGIVVGQYPIEINLDKNMLIQTPDLEQAILDSIQFTEFEQKLSRKINTNEMKQEKYDKMLSKLKETKMGFWNFILMLWLVQCSFMVKNSKESKEWNIRLQSV